MWQGTPAEARSLLNLGSSHDVEDGFANYGWASLIYFSVNEEFFKRSLKDRESAG